MSAGISPILRDYACLSLWLTSARGAPAPTGNFLFDKSLHATVARSSAAARHRRGLGGHVHSGSPIADFSILPHRKPIHGLEELGKGAIILYPRYVDPSTHHVRRSRTLIERLLHVEPRNSDQLARPRWVPRSVVCAFIIPATVAKPGLH